MSEFLSHPSCAEEALALLYVQNQNLANKTPAELFTMYSTALKEIQQTSLNYEHEHRHWLNAK